MTHHRMPARGVPDGYIDKLAEIRAAVREIIPGGRDPERSYLAKDEAMRGLSHLIGDRR